MALVARVTLGQGRRAAFITTLGICSGLPLHATASALGISAILATSAMAFTVAKLLGAAYLIWLGIQSFRHAPPAEPAASEHPETAHTSATTQSPANAHSSATTQSSVTAQASAAAHSSA